MKKILIIDNSIVIVNVLKDLFNNNNNNSEYKLYIAKSLKEALSLINENTFFASISNIVLTDALDGEIIEVLEDKKIPTIVLSSKIDQKFISTMNNSKIVDYILKDSIHGINMVYQLIELLSYIEGREVLIVEDSPFLASSLKNLLECFLLDVHVSNNGEKALEVLKNNPNIKFIITDYNMPVMDGFELLKVLKKNESYVDIPVIIVSSESNPNIRVNFLKQGATDFISKPILEEELKSKLMNIFTTMKHTEELESFNSLMEENIITSSTDVNGIITYVSGAFMRISGYSKEELIGYNHRIIRHPDMPNSIYKELWTTIKSGQKWKGEIKNLRKDGSYYWVSSLVEPKFDHHNNIIGYVSIRHDITDKKRIYELSIKDALTSLYNRRYFNETADSVISTTVRDNKVFAFLLLDIDNFKKYNDTYGHQEGDNVLIQVSKSLIKTFKRSEDNVFRLGGEEFGVLMSAKTREDIIMISELAREGIESLNIEHKLNIPYGKITASFGVSIITADDYKKSHELDYIYKISDNLLYEAKDSGRNVVKYIDLN